MTLANLNSEQSSSVSINTTEQSAYLENYPPAQPSVSIIVITYNQSRFLPHVLHSLAVQQYRGACEVVVCDDGSADEHSNKNVEALRRMRTESYA